MLQEVKRMRGWTVHALDGEMGRVDELLFDDENWAIRYVVVETGSWLSQRKVLISPLAFTALDGENKTLQVNLTQEKVRNSPEAASDPPVSRPWEANYADYYGWPYYWGESDPTHSHDDDERRHHAAAHLRSTKDVIAHTVVATDGSLGHIDDFLIDDVSWKVAYLAVDTKDWWHGKKVLIPPTWIKNMSWLNRIVSVGATREHVKNAPEWQTGQLVTPNFEALLQAYYAYKNPIQASTHKDDKNTFVAIYDTHSEAETAIRALQQQGFDMTKLSIIGRDYHTEEEVVGYYTAGDRMKAWGKTGAFWGGIWSLMFGSAFFLVPGIGPILAAGPVVVWIVGALESAVVVGGFSALGGALFSIGIPNDRIIAYEEHLKVGKFLVIAHDVQNPRDTDLIAQEVMRHHNIK
ncbi:PRC-barrel domain-containing protein [Armatimonas sp.]|uniref:PRC-barrel domain-containing protein n=1 Tax=Armatimonas sp. TaxID=1872638 RepID=UPI00374CB339